MSQRLIPALLLFLLVMLHSQLWLGRGSVPQVNALRLDLQQQQLANESAQFVNAQLTNEVRDLQEGLEMVEELARYELGMVKPNEMFVQFSQTAR